MTTVPQEQILDSHQLIAEGQVDLYTLTPSGGTGTLNFKADDDVTWRGTFFKGMPVALTGEKRSADTGYSMPKMTIGQPDIDLSLFKPMIYDGYLDNAIIVRQTVLTNHLINNQNIKTTRTYRVKRVEQYSRTQIVLQLATLSDSLGFSLPYRQYLPPAFPTVQL